MNIDNLVTRQFLNTCSALRFGSLRIVTPEGHTHDFGHGLPEAELQIRDWSMVSACALRGDVGLGETYSAGLWDTPSIEALGQVAVLNLQLFSSYAFGSIFNRLKFRLLDTVLRANSRRGSARNVRAHYDLGNEFYQLWLDTGMTYSAALYSADDDDLLRAQNRKYDRILDQIGDSTEVLEIGCGWGGFAERAVDQGRRVTAITLSPNQHAYADARLDGRAKIALCDYRDTSGRFDAVISVEMIEAVGQKYWPDYFATLKNRLADGGRAVIQAITVNDANFETYRNSSDFIRQYVFPGGMLLSDAQINLAAQNAGLKVEESFAFGQSYARTCRQWGKNLQDRRRRIGQLGYDQEFLRGWDYYLGICAASFAVGNTNVVQVSLSHG